MNHEIISKHEYDNLKTLIDNKELSIEVVTIKEATKYCHAYREYIFKFKDGKSFKAKTCSTRNRLIKYYQL